VPEEETNVANWVLPPKLVIERRPNILSVWFRVWWPSLFVSFVLWIAVINVSSPDDTWWDATYFAFFVGSLTRLIFTFTYLVIGIPLIGLACIWPMSIVWRWWICIPFGVFIATLGTEAFSKMSKGESSIGGDGILVSMAATYGLIVGFFLFLKRPKRTEQGWV